MTKGTEVLHLKFKSNQVPILTQFSSIFLASAFKKANSQAIIKMHVNFRELTKTSSMPTNSSCRCILTIFGFILVAGLIYPETQLVGDETANSTSLNGMKLDLVFNEDFSGGSDRWKTTDDKAWNVKTEGDLNSFGLNRRKSNYNPTHRSPHNIALINDLKLGDFVVEFKVRSTKDTGNHRDCCVFFGYQNDEQFYYAHLGAKPDPASGQIMIVNKAPRTPLTNNEKPVPWDDDWHNVKVTREVSTGKVAIYFDDMSNPQMTATDKTFGSGLVGLGSFDDMNDFANVRVYGKVEAASTISATNTASNSQPSTAFEFRDSEKIAFVGGSLAERMNLFGHFESNLHLQLPDKKLIVRNFGWPADEVGKQQRPENYTVIDDPMTEFAPELFFCFFGFNEHFAGASEKNIAKFKKDYRNWISKHKQQFSTADRPTRFILLSPAAFESTDNPHLPKGDENNKDLKVYSEAVRELADELKLPFVDLFTPTMQEYNAKPGAQYTINGVHANLAGDKVISDTISTTLLAASDASKQNSPDFEQVREAVVDKSWFHLQDYRMLNGWYVYGRRRTWDKQTFPGEYQKIRKMVSVRDQYIWDMAAGKEVPENPDDSGTGEVFIPDTMFGTRDDNFRKMREPKTLEYPTPESSIEQMTVPEGFEVQLFASEREFPEFSNPTQMAFDSKGRLWVSCMINYPQWLPGSAKPGDKLLIFEDTDGDGKADECKTFYDRLICPTGFEFYEDGVLVVDEPRILFLRDTDGDDQADETTHVLDGIATDDTHHAMGAWEWSHGGLLYMLEGIAMSTTIETPWGPLRNKGPSGGYILDPKSWKFRYFRTPGYGNPWCMVFDRWGMGVVGDGTNARQHWTSPLSGFRVPARKTLRPNFDNEGMRPAVGSEYLLSRHFPEDVQGQFIYACVINMHGIPRFDLGDEEGTAGYSGKRIENLIDSTDNFFRPVDPKIGPDGALWFGDWCNALIGHMQYSQRDPNRDHQHGRIYRLVHKEKDLIKPELQADSSVPELLSQLLTHELRTRYRVRRELRTRDEQQVLAEVKKWIAGDATAEKLCEALWVQEGFRKLDPALIKRLMEHEDFHARSAAVHSVANEMERYEDAQQVFEAAIGDKHPRVRLEGVRAISFIPSADSIATALTILEQPMDYWLEYTLEHTLQALKRHAKKAKEQGTFLSNSTDKAKSYYEEFVLASQPGGKAIKPLKIAQDPERPKAEQQAAMAELAKLKGGNGKKGMAVYEQVCSACHQLQGKGKAFGPPLDAIASRFQRKDIIKHILWPNEEIAKGFETVQVLTLEGEMVNGFVLAEGDEKLTLGVATDDGKGKSVEILKDDVDERKDMKASSMPEGLVKTIAPSEFLDLIEYLAGQFSDKDGWIGTMVDKSKLRKHGKFVEISRDAALKIGKDFPAIHNRSVHMTLANKGSGKQGFAFHSSESSSKPPHIVIRLAEPSSVRHIRLENRPGERLMKRAKGLKIWLSEDGESWNEAWQSDEVKSVYDAAIPTGDKAKFVKVGLKSKGILHLKKIVVFGEK